jgi:hypothetical protein
MALADNPATLVVFLSTKPLKKWLPGRDPKGSPDMYGLSRAIG